MTFKEWLSSEGVTSHSQIQMIPNMGNADVGLRSNYWALDGNDSPLPKGAMRKSSPSHMDKDPGMSVGFGMKRKDRKESQARSIGGRIHKGASPGAPLRTPRVYT